jgi:hypothetical protein
MSFYHINNLYKETDILLLKRCYCLEKIHGTSSHIRWDGQNLHLFSGGASQEQFELIFDKESLKTKFAEIGKPMVVYGEAYGGKMQGMKASYGDELKFVAFDVKIGDSWLSVPQAESLVKSLGLEFVHYVETSTDLKELDEQRDAPSMQAIRNGCGNDKLREGVILRPLIELTKNNGERLIAKHKRDEFRETKTPREVNPEKLQILQNAELIANEWVTEQRLIHVLDKLPKDINVESTALVIKSMVEDVEREANGEIVNSDASRKAISRATALMFKNFLKKKLQS